MIADFDLDEARLKKDFFEKSVRNTEYCVDLDRRAMVAEERAFANAKAALEAARTTLRESEVRLRFLREILEALP